MSAKLHVEADTHEEMLDALRKMGVRGIPGSRSIPEETCLHLEVIESFIRLLYGGKKTRAIELLKQHFKMNDLEAMNYVNRLFDEFFVGVEVS